MIYTVGYDPKGTPSVILRSDGLCIPINATGNADWNNFLTWNSQQAVPLDYVSIGPKARVLRTFFAVYNDLAALTGTQKTNVWTDLTTGTPPKIALDNGTYGGMIGLLWRLGQAPGTLPAAFITDMKIVAATYYVLDNPSYLVNPSFDPTINVAGDQPG